MSATARALLVAVLFGFAIHAHAATTSFEVLVDTDVNSATGCSVATPAGTLTGFELRVAVPVNTSTATGTVGALTVATCAGGVFGSPTQFDGGGWPVGVGLGTTGSDVIEAYLPLSLVGSSSSVRLVVVSSAEVIGPVTVPLGGVPALVDIPTLSSLAMAVLAIGLALLALLYLRPGSGVGVVILVLLSGSGLAWAAIAAHDGNPADWSSVSPLATDASGDAPAGADLVALYARRDGANLELRIDARLAFDSGNQSPVVNAGADQTIALPASATLTGSATDDGLPAPPGTLTYSWTQVSGPSTVAFGTPSAASTTATFPTPGIFVLRLAASDGTLSGSDTVQVTATGLETVADEANAVQQVVGPGGGSIQTTSGGKTYTLTIPVAALPADTTVTLTPLTAIPNLPLFSGGLLAAVDLQPTGLQFDRPATLAVTLPAPVAATGLLGFLLGDAGTDLEILDLSVAGTTLTLEVPHFTAAGVAQSVLSDFERDIRPILDSLTIPVSSTAADNLLSRVGSWIDAYGFAVCTGTDLCGRAFSIAAESLAQNQQQACDQTQTFIQQGEPFLARTALATVVRLAAELTDLSERAVQVGVPGFEIEFDPTCVAEKLNAISDLAKTQAIANPRAGLLVLLVDIAGDGALLSLDDVAAHANAALLSVLNAILAEAESDCLAAPASGEFLIDLVLNALTDLFLDAVDTGLATRFHDARAGCRIRISPALPTIGFGSQLQFTGTVVGLALPTVTWSIEGFALGSMINPSTGLFTAGSIQGTVVVVATSVANIDLFKRNPVVVVEGCPAPGTSSSAGVRGPMRTGGCLPTVAVSPANVSLAPGGTQQFTATVTGATSQAVTWTATGGTITSGGFYTAPATNGTHTVTARSVEVPTATGSATVVVGTPTPITGGYDGTETNQVLGCTPECTTDSRVARYALLQSNQSFLLIRENNGELFCSSFTLCSLVFSINNGQFQATGSVGTITGSVVAGRLQFVFDSPRVISGQTVTNRTTFDGPHLVFQVTPTSLDFGTVPVGTSASQLVTIRNDGLLPVGVSVAHSLGFGNPFTTSGNTCFVGGNPSANTFFLENGTACQLAIQFSPTSQGVRTDTLGVTAFAGSSPLVAPVAVSLTGVGN